MIHTLIDPQTSEIAVRYFWKRVLASRKNFSDHEIIQNLTRVGCGERLLKKTKLWLEEPDSFDPKLPEYEIGSVGYQALAHTVNRYIFHPTESEQESSFLERLSKVPDLLVSEGLVAEKTRIAARFMYDFRWVLNNMLHERDVENLI